MERLITLMPVLLSALVLAGALTFGLSLAVSRRRRFDLEQRLSLLSPASQSAKPEAVPGVPAKSQGKVFQLERLLLLSPDYPLKLELSPAKLTIVAIACAALTWLAFHGMLHAPMAFSGLLACLGAYFGVRMMILRERSRLEATFTALFPDAVDAVARMLRAGLPVTSAFQMVCQEAPPPVDAVFETLAGQLKIGMPIEDALRLGSQRIRLPDFQFFAVAVVLQQSAGGNLLPTLEALTQMMRARRAMQAKARAATAEVRFSAYVLGALPFITVAALLLVSPDYLTPLFHDPRGHAILFAAAAGLVMSGLVMQHMMRSIEDA